MKTIVERFLFPKSTISHERLRKAIFGKTIVITGASYGIGEELALLFSGYEVHLVLIARTEEKLLTLSETVRSNGSKCTLIPADLYRENEVGRVIEELGILDCIDIFISNAGKSINRSLQNSLDRYHDFTRTNSLNYLAPVRLLLAMTPKLKANKGQVINVSAINVLLPPASGWAAYQASKTAFDQWFRSNSAEWKSMRIQVKTIYLPLVRTRMIAPNENYKNYPAMQPQQAAVRIARLVCSGSNSSKPWWAIFVQAGGFFGRGLWERYSLYRIRRQND
ncbi:SDR family NAD(P)-dependent oxidoreductase [Flavobacterium sp. MFBS3-15]|uniref:SDR family NAD(P)-dependent oxidoreductase n=1 Tax=Flavobacterium sp. MFBS3-15 TaxID=2989816 RepID=UPI002235CA3D|nr:SDR family NAD(P)-dependent oxidoreductase [Flavobacterium sp. MFBS3-15]MCW4470490.1 SDR family NAD(P)-dependent oxidoreductase [Flavobacterium sp. MFBS3-15]